jgi:hypothetical protein
MTRAELVKLVEQAFATYNQNLPGDEDKLKTLYSAWYDLLHDLEYDATKKAFLRLAVNAQYLPRPGELRRATINTDKKIPQFDDPIVAWGKFIAIIRNVNSGVVEHGDLQQPLTETIRRLGEAALGMHTNSDREAFSRVYESVLTSFYEIVYEPKDIKSEIR